MHLDALQLSMMLAYIMLDGVMLAEIEKPYALTTLLINTWHYQWKVADTKVYICESMIHIL